MLLDATGTELTFIYKNQILRKLKADSAEATYMIASMVNPPQGQDYRPLPGDLFPKTYPFDYGSIFTYNYFWLKYYISQRTYFALAKRPNYVNYEVMVNALNC